METVKRSVGQGFGGREESTVGTQGIFRLNCPNDTITVETSHSLYICQNLDNVQQKE